MSVDLSLDAVALHIEQHGLEQSLLDIPASVIVAPDLRALWQKAQGPDQAAAMSAREAIGELLAEHEG